MVRTFTKYILLLLVFAGGCKSFIPRPEHRVLEAGVVPDLFSGSESQTNAVKSLQLPEHWWQVFGSDELNTLIETAFTNNLDMAAAVARLRQAREQMVIAGAAGGFFLNGSGGAQVDKNGDTRSGFNVNDTRESYSLGLQASYEVDIWGRISSNERAAELSYAATAEQLNATALMISGEITRAWVQYKTALLEMDLIREQIGTSEKALELLKVRQRAALSAAVDVYQQESQVAALERLLPQLEEQCSDLRIRLKYLLGSAASFPLPVKVSAESLPDVDELPACGVPADLLVNRPDIRAAWLALQSREWSVASREAERFPTLTLSGSLSFESPEISDVLQNWYANLAAGLVGPILDGGRRKAEVRLAEAQADENFVGYTDAVLLAIQDVEQALARESSRRKYLTAVEREITLSDKTLKESANRYRKGLMEYLNVLTALSAKQNAERRALAAENSLVLNRVALYQALGGRELRMGN